MLLKHDINTYNFNPILSSLILQILNSPLQLSVENAKADRQTGENQVQYQNMVLDNMQNFGANISAKYNFSITFVAYLHTTLPCLSWLD